MATDRFYIAPLGEHYDECLAVEAFIKRRTMANEGNSLLCAKLMERESKRDAILARMAKKRGISPESLWDDIVTGKAEHMTRDEFRELRDSGVISSDDGVSEPES
jgi:hypothetical protein